MGVKEIFANSEPFKLLVGQVIFVAAGDRVQNSASVQRLDDADQVLSEYEFIVLGQDPVPKCVV